MTYEVHLTTHQRARTAVVRGRVTTSDIADFLGTAYDEVLRVLARQGTAPAGPPFSRYAPTGDGHFDVEAGFPVRGVVEADGRVVASELPGGSVASTLHTGPYDQVAAAHTALSRWLDEHGHDAAGCAWESYLDEPDVDRPLTEVLVPCAPVPAGRR